jgi:toxin YoeB
MIIAFTPQGWEDYTYWQQENQKLLLKLNRIILEITREPFKGIAKPEPLKNELKGWWSRRIDDEHRIVYQIRGEVLMINQCRHHY